MTLESIESLREWVRHLGENGHLGRLSEMCAQGLLNIADAIQAEVDSRFMELPVDADGVPIHVGDVMCSAGIREKGHKVIVSAIFEDGFVEYGNDNGLIGPLCQEDWVHVNPRTIEDVLEDFIAAYDEWDDRSTDDRMGERGRLFAEYAEKMREAVRDEQ